MNSPDSDELRAEVRSLLETATLANVAFVALSMTRKDGETPAEDAQFPVDLGMGVQVTEDGVAYRVTVGVERPDISVSVSVVALYQSAQSSAFLQSPDVARVFGQMVAIPALFPYARAKLQELTIDTGVERPVLLGILDMTRAIFTPTDDGDTDAEDDSEESISDISSERSVSETPPTDLAQ